MMRELNVMRQRLCGFLLGTFSTEVDLKVRMSENFAEAERKDRELGRFPTTTGRIRSSLDPNQEQVSTKWTKQRRVSPTGICFKCGRSKQKSMGLPKPPTRCLECGRWDTIPRSAPRRGARRSQRGGEESDEKNSNATLVSQLSKVKGERRSRKVAVNFALSARADIGNRRFY